MARPKKSEANKRTSTVLLKLTQAEHEELHYLAKAHNMPLATYLRRRGLGLKLPPAKIDQQLMSEATASLLRLGVNLNQLVKHLNTGRDLVYRKTIRLIDLIDREMGRLHESYRD